MNNKKIRKDIYKIFLPTLISYLGFVLVTIVDGIFVGNLYGIDGISAVGLVQPFILLITSMIFSITIGANTFIGIAYGENNIKKANYIFNMSLIYGSFLILMIAFFSIILSERIFSIYTDNISILMYAKKYSYVILPAQALSFFPIMLSSSRRIVRDNKLLVIFSIISFTTNVSLNTILAVILNFGITGIAISTLCSFLFQIFFGLIYYSKKKVDIFQFKLVRLDIKQFFNIFINGLSDAFFDIASAVIQLFNNYLIVILVGSIGLTYNYILYTIMIFIFIIFFALGDAINPLISYNHGSKNHDYIKSVKNNAFKISIVIGIIIYLIINIVKPYIFQLYGVHSGENYEYLMHYSYFLFLIAFVFGINQIMTSFMTSIGRSKLSLVYGVFRNLIVLIFTTFIMTYFFLDIGYWMAYFLSEIISIFIGFYLYNKYLKK